MFRLHKSARIVTFQSSKLLFQPHYHTQAHPLAPHPHLLSQIRSFSSSKRNFSHQSQQVTSPEPLSDLEIQARNIQASIDGAKGRIEAGIEKGLGVAEAISGQVEEDKFLKMQRFNIFISKMEQLARQEKTWNNKNRKAVRKMQSAFLTSQKPLKDLLHFYNKASVQGFQSKLAVDTLQLILMTMRARGNQPRPYEDYTTREFDVSWRMQMLAGHLKTALTEEVYFNHYDIGQSSRLLGQIGYKDVEVIQAYFDKLDKLLQERQENYSKKPTTVNFEKAVYGNFLNFVPRHYVFEGFESNEEFQQHLKTLLEWQVRTNNGLETLGVESTSEIMELEESMGKLIAAASTVNDLNINIQASIDSLRQQYFKLQEVNDKFEWMNENKFIRLELLELQEKLVRAGYLLPDEADQITSSQPYDVRMQRAAKIFYNYVSNCVPEFMSPQYTEFIKAAHESVDNRQEPRNQISLNEEHDLISLSSLSQTLVGLHSQCLSYRRESNDKDYLHEYYENLALEVENMMEQHDELAYDRSIKENEHVNMARDYLRAYKIFEKETAELFKPLRELIYKSSGDAEGLLHSLLALSVCKFEASDIRKFVNTKFLQIVQDKEKDLPEMRPQALIDGLKGIAMQNQLQKQSMAVAQFCIQRLQKNLGTFPEQKLTFDQRLDVLWSACALGLESQGTIVKSLYMHLQTQNFQRTQNDLTFQQFQLIRDFQLYLTQVSPVKDLKWVNKNVHPVLDILTRNPRFHEVRYNEYQACFDPFKKRVMLAMGQGLSQASIDHEFFTEGHMLSQGDALVGRDEEKFPYPPDIIIGYNGQKVLLEVITASQTMRDIGKPDGVQKFRHKILKGLNSHDKNMRVVSIPINSVVNYDVENMKVILNKDYNFLKDIIIQVQAQGSLMSNPFNFNSLATFGSRFTGAISNYYQTLKRDSDRQKIDGFLKQLYKVFMTKQHTEKQFESELYQKGLEKTKFELMKLSLLYDSIPLHLQQFIDSHVSSNQNSKANFQSLIIEARDKTNWEAWKDTQLNQELDKQIDFGWMGTRLEVELPQIKELPFTKNIMPEIINQRFMWVDDYFHYQDWEQAQKQVYDNFNLLTVPRNEGEFKYFYNRGTNQRIVPQGIFPPPSGKRDLLKPPVNLYANELEDLQNLGNDSITLFERDPLRYMILKEEKRSSQLQNINQEVNFITNLQNIKQGLKADYSDKDLIDLILGNSTFTDELVQEHVKKASFQVKDQQDKQTQFLDRDPKEFRDFVRYTYESKDQEDPFTHFYIKEAGKVERIHKVHKDAEEKYNKLIDQSIDFESKKKAMKLKKSLEDKVVDMLLENKVENEDPSALSHQIDSEIKITYNMRSLMKTEAVYDIDPDLNAADISDQAFLQLQRRRAETKIIKAKIIYKQYQGIELNNHEQKYLEAWVSTIQKSPHINILTVRDSMLQSKHSKLSLADSLNAEDFYAFSQIPNVDLNLQEHGKFALNDLILELSHFIDDDFVNRVEQQMISERVKKEWQLPDDFQVIETRNKEIGIIINELEELAWRMAGQFDEREINTLKEMFSVTRNKDYFDRQFYTQDMQSLEQFIQKVNAYDHRQEFLQEWAIRKEEEWKGRAALPPKHLRKSDEEIHALVDAKLKKARESLVAKLLEKEDSTKTYQDLTTADLRLISEQFVIRLALFNGDYPLFVTQIVKAIMEHPNLSLSDHSKIKTFCQMFELDWRGDRSLSNKREYMSHSPIYLNEADSTNVIGYGKVGNFEATAMMRYACVPFVEDLSKKIIQSAKKNDK